MSKKNGDVIITFVILGIIFSFSILFILTPKKKFSENENRYLQELPVLDVKNILNGKYAGDLNSYLSDHFYARDRFINIKTITDKLLMKTKINGVYLAKDGYLIEEYNTSLYYDRIIKVLNKFSEKVDIPVQLMLVPTSYVINSSKLPIYIDSDDQLADMNYIYDNIVFDTINIYDSLMRGNKKYKMFYSYDHHWTSYGAYYAYLEYCFFNSIVPLPIYEFDIKVISNDFKGTLFSKINDYQIKGEEMHLFDYSKFSYTLFDLDNNVYKDTLYYSEYLYGKDKYSYYLGTNKPILIIYNNTINTNDELLIIKDSYANSLAPFLINHYKKIHIIDPRYYSSKISNYILNNKINNVLIIYNMNTLGIDSCVGKIS